MKAKVFWTGRNDSKLEEGLNEFLEQNPDIELVHVSQAAVPGANHAGASFCTLVFYNENSETDQKMSFKSPFGAHA